LDFIRKTSDESYEVRVTVPDHLVPVLKRKNLTKRLGTKSRAEAKRRSHEHVDAFLKIIADAALVLSDQAERVDIMAALQALDRWTNASVACCCQRPLRSVEVDHCI